MLNNLLGFLKRAPSNRIVTNGQFYLLNIKKAMALNQMITEWKAVSSRIESLMDAGRFYYSALQVNSSDPYKASKKFITPEAKKIFSLIKSFQTDYAPIIPIEAKSCLDEFIREHASVFGKRAQQDDAKFFLVALSTLEAETSYLLNNTQQHIKKSVEIAFAHLQRQIVADVSVRKIWSVSSNKETDYEKLGGSHFLLHKIWAFKAHSSGERTDLVLSEPIRSDDLLLQSVDGLVLTEWKTVNSAQELDQKIAAAKNQAKRYACGSLSALELSNYCYLVMVSKDHLSLPRKEIEEDQVVYRVINIAYSPSAPSKSTSHKSRI